MKDLVVHAKTTLAGLGQFVLASSFIYLKLKNGQPFTDTEVTLFGTLMLSAFKGFVSADASQVVTK